MPGLVFKKIWYIYIYFFFFHSKPLLRSLFQDTILRACKPSWYTPQCPPPTDLQQRLQLTVAPQHLDQYQRAHSVLLDEGWLQSRRWVGHANKSRPTPSPLLNPKTITSPQISWGHHRAQGHHWAYGPLLSPALAWTCLLKPASKSNDCYQTSRKS